MKTIANLVLTGILVITLSGCTTPIGFSPITIKPLSKETKIGKLSAEDSFLELDVSFSDVRLPNQFTMPPGIYRPVGESDGSIYYGAPSPIILNGIEQIGGGFDIKKTGGWPHMYVIGTNGIAARSRLSIAFIQGEGTKWRIASKQQRETAKIEDFRKCSVRVTRINDQLTGPYELYDQKGNTEITGEFIANKKTGCWTVKESGGNTIAQIHYKDGTIEGPVLLWYGPWLNEGKSTGQKKLETTIINGEYHGSYRSFMGNGDKRMEVVFDHGKIITAKLYHNNKIVIENIKEAEKYVKKDIEDNCKLFSGYEEIIDLSLKYSQIIK